MSLNRRQLAAWMLGAPWLSPAARASTAGADAWPSQPLTVVVPFSPGGSVDVAARLVMPRLAERLRQPVVIENTVGASGTAATINSGTLDVYTGPSRTAHTTCVVPGPI